MNAFTSVWSRNALFLMLLVMLTGCTLPPVPRPFSCASFTESRWAVFRFGVDSPDDVVSTVARLWGIERDQVQFMLTISEEVYMARWRSSTIVGAGGAYEASFQEDQKLGKISVTWGNPRPRLYQIIDCLGFPDHYIAFFDPFEVTYLSLALVYADTGIVVRHNAIVGSSESARIHPHLRMERFVVVPPGTAERVVTDMYSHGYEVRDHVYSVCLLLPWPGSIEAMEIASDEEKTRCGYGSKWQ